MAKLHWVQIAGIVIAGLLLFISTESLKWLFRFAKKSKTISHWAFVLNHLINIHVFFLFGNITLISFWGWVLSPYAFNKQPATKEDVLFAIVMAFSMVLRFKALEDNIKHWVNRSQEKIQKTVKERAIIPLETTEKQLQDSGN